MHSKLWILTLSVACVMLAPAALASNNPNDNGGGSGGGNNNGSGGGPRPTPGLEMAVFTGLGTAGYMGYQFLKSRGNQK